MIKTKILFYSLLFILTFLLISSCSTTNYTVSNNIQAVNIKPSDGKWLIDYPILKNVDNSLSAKTLTYYKESLQKTFTNVYAVTDFSGFSSLNHVVKKDANVLMLYKEKTNCDYLIETEIRLVKDDLPTLQLLPDKTRQNELKIQITVYDINSRQIAMDKEYFFVNSFEGNDDIAFAPKVDKFVNKAVKAAISDFGKKYNWKLIDKTTIVQK